MTIELSQAAISLVAKVTIILAAGLTATALMRRLSAEVRHLALLVTVGSAVILPFALVVTPRWAVPVLPSATRAPGNAATPSPIVDAPSRSALAPAPSEAPVTISNAGREQTVTRRDVAVSRGSTWLIVVSAFWAIGALAMVLRIAVGHARLRQIAREAKAPHGDSWRQLLDAERERMSVAKPVRLLTSAETTTPVTWGIRPAVILLPSSAREWPDARRRAVLRHELAHIARGDAEARWLTAVLCTFYWFHPLAWLVARAMRIEGEVACDDRVLVSGMRAAEYADHLLEIARTTRAAGPPELLAVRMASQPHIARRIFAVLDASRPRRRLAPLTRAAAVGAGMVVLLTAGACQLVQRADAQGVGSIAGTRTIENGVTVVSHTASVFTRVPQLELETTPIARTEAADLTSENDLRFVHDAVLLSDGRIAAFRVIDPVVFIFDPTGQLQRRIGKLGKEPGDFMAPHGMTALSGDTLWIHDDANGRVNWITADGGFVRTASVARQVSMLDPRGQLRDGKIVMGSSIVDSEVREGTWRPATPIALTGAEMTDVRILDTVPGLEMTRIATNYRGRSRQQANMLRLGRHTSIVAWDAHIAVATGENGYEIEQRDQDGTAVARLRVDQPRRPVTQSMRNAQIAGELARIDGPQSEGFVDIEETRRQARENPFADSLPPYGLLFATPDKTLWVVDAIAPGDSAWSATAFRADGSIVGRLNARMSSFPLFFGDDRVIIRVQDADGRVSLRVHRIVPAKS